MSSDQVITEVLDLLGPMVAPDGGSLAVREYDAAAARLVVDYFRGKNDECSSCVIDGESLKAFIEDGLENRGVRLSEVTVAETLPA